ncbi:AraC family transcriptional regulator [Streptomyces sp.]|uniref:AraC family transcriptional regulator n=1 Tax=Streptomyces sp. TaxID=1931 RepID=UPI002D79AA71|nr:AraC family transcriptional regulator [Streptomyces sp.]HET6356628.1 AraC family transcriptional regulator [Streptomyces sp.]
MTTLIKPEQLPIWVPGQLTVCSSDAGWDGISVRGYRYAGSDVLVPPMRDFMIVAYRRGTTPMRRRVDGQWLEEQLAPGDVSLLTRAADSHWVWDSDIEVVHVYLTQEELAATCKQMYERDIQDVELRDEVKADDPAIHHTAMLIAREAAHGGAGSSLLVESLSCQLAVHILRRHAHVLFRESHTHDGLTFRQERAVRDYIHEHLSENITLDDIAASVALSRYHFARRFHASTGTTPHEYVLQQRVARAQTLLIRTNYPLLDIALTCGFADQSHLNRVFKKHTGVTPGHYRKHS